MKVFINALLGLSALVFVGCQSPNEVDDQHEEPVTLSFTVWTDETELFVEFEPLVVGQLTSFAAHFSEMQEFKAIEEGKVTVSLVSGSKGIRNTADSPTSPGIFRPAIEPTSAGIFDLIFEIETPFLKDKIVLKDITVFESTEKAIAGTPHQEENSEEISFLKEQAWKMEFSTIPVGRNTIYNVINVGGEILPSQGDELTITATANGIVVYNSSSLSIGATISNGQSLFTVTGGNISNSNIQTEFAMAKSNYARAKSNYERKAELYQLEAIAKSEFETAKNEFELAQSEYNSLSTNYSKSGKSVKTKTGGFIKKLFRQEGEYVEAGQPLAIITQNKKLTLRANVPQSEYSRLDQSMTANFSLNGENYSINEFNGSLLSFGKSVSHDNPKIPVYFELDNTGELLAGSYIDVWLKTTPISQALIIPTSSLLENNGTYSVIVQTGGESFEKRAVILGVSDGISVHVISGVDLNERIVVKGAYQVKMSAMSGQTPAHGHAH
ncbi:MAG: cobalt-zinc-cadmium efflux system membrane fusion protein [Flavobacteriaceae bacterium]|jgi:cobalt-zinc-cadmium efflux system membrane fusion protein